MSALMLKFEVTVATRDGLERIQLPEHATVAELKKQINSNLSIPVEDITLSRNKDLVRLCYAQSFLARQTRNLWKILGAALQEMHCHSPLGSTLQLEKACRRKIDLLFWLNPT